MLNVCMVKLSQQLEQKEVVKRPTRTERVKAQQDLQRARLEQKRFEEAREKISKANYENYEEIYNSISPKYREGITTPEELKQTAGYQNYLQEKAKQTEIERWRSTFDAYNRRNRPFVLGLSPSKERVTMFNEFKKAMSGRTSSVPPYVIDFYRSGVRKDFGVSKDVYGIDKGEVFTVTTKSKEGEIISEKVYTGTGEGGYTKQTTTYLTGEKLREAQEKAYQEFLKEQPDVDVGKLEKTNGRGEGYIDAKTGKWVSSPTESRKWYDRSLQELIIQPAKSKVSQGFSWIGGKAKQGLNIADDYVRWDLKVSGSPTLPMVSLISFGKEEPSIDVDKFITEQQEELSEASFNI